MKTRDVLDATKLRGGYYTPGALVSDVLGRARELLGPTLPTRAIEPSAGDGAFLSALAQQFPSCEITGVEIDVFEASKASGVLNDSGSEGRIVNDTFLEWSRGQRGYDLVVGNLPFVRFQFISERDRLLAAAHADESGVQIGGVANLWWPMLLAALRTLRPGGVFSLILPSECLTGVTAGSAREWLIRSTTDLRVDNFPPGTFPAVLQDVVIVSGRWTGSVADSAEITYVEYSSSGHEQVRTVRMMPASTANWISLLLGDVELEALEEAKSTSATCEMRAVARFEVAAVTGANAFFSLTDEQVDRRRLNKWVVPLLSRMKYAPGLIYTEDDHLSSAAHGATTNLFAVAGPLERERQMESGLDAYLTEGESAGFHTRFKTRTRQPWYAIPSVRREALLMSKRSHHFPRVTLNRTEAVTTDTIYRGRVVAPGVTAGDVAAAFHNSMTLLTAELEGRSFGGGVLELVPSEVSRLSIPVVPGLDSHLPELDLNARRSGADGAPEVLVRQTNLLIADTVAGLPLELLSRLEQTRLRLLGRRLSRN